MFKLCLKKSEIRVVALFWKRFFPRAFFVKKIEDPTNYFCCYLLLGCHIADWRVSSPQTVIVGTDNETREACRFSSLDGRVSFFQFQDSWSRLVLPISGFLVASRSSNFRILCGHYRDSSRWIARCDTNQIWFSANCLSRRASFFNAEVSNEGTWQVQKIRVKLYRLFTWDNLNKYTKSDNGFALS